MQWVGVNEALAMPSSGILRRVALVRIDVSEERIAIIIRVARIGELEALAITSNRSTLRNASVDSYFLGFPSSPILSILMTEAVSSFETSILRGVTRRHIPEDGIVPSHRRENFKSHIALTGWAL
jgi:hypothetical protein